MSTTTRAKPSVRADELGSPLGIGRIIGRLGGLFGGRKFAPGVREDDLGPIDRRVVPETDGAAFSPPPVAVALPVMFAPSRRGLQRSLESSRELLEPIVDVFEETDHLLVAVILPGVDPALAQVELSGDLLVITSVPPSPIHRKEIPLPAVFDQECMSRSERDGVVEVRLDLNRARRTTPGSGSGD